MHLDGVDTGHGDRMVALKLLGPWLGDDPDYVPRLPRLRLDDIPSFDATWSDTDDADGTVTLSSSKALAIEGGRPGLSRTYEETVIAGDGAFVMTAESRADFARAMRAKLIREIA